MAFTEQHSYETHRDTYFNVSFAVGANADNWWTDIQLVQYFIRTIYLLNNSGANSWNLSQVSINELSDLPDPHKDFKALTKTAKWIRYFQTDAILMNSYPMLANGRVERGKIGTTEYMQTIYLLNIKYQMSLKSFGIDEWFIYALNDAMMPSKLRAQLLEKTTVTIL